MYYSYSPSYTIAIVHACTLAIVRACSRAIVHSRTVATVYACIAILHACDIAIAHVSCLAGLVFPAVDTDLNDIGGELAQQISWGTSLSDFAVL